MVKKNSTISRSNVLPYSVNFTTERNTQKGKYKVEGNSSSWTVNPISSRLQDLKRDVQARLMTVETYGGETFLSEDVAINILQETKNAFGRAAQVCLFYLPLPKNLALRQVGTAESCGEYSRSAPQISLPRTS